MRRIFLFILAILLGTTNGLAQDKEYQYEIGAGGGINWYYGDGNRSKAFSDQALAVDLLLRYNADLRWAYAIDLSSQGLGNARYWQLAFRPEFAFWNYGLGSDYREKHRIAPFLTIGIGFGCTSGLEENAVTCTIPLGVGIKWKMAPRWNAQLTAQFSKSFNDRLDGIEDPYKVGTTTPMNTDWIGSIILSITFDFKERCIECRNQDSF